MGGDAGQTDEQQREPHTECAQLIEAERANRAAAAEGQRRAGQQPEALLVCNHSAWPGRPAPVPVQQLVEFMPSIHAVETTPLAAGYAAAQAALLSLTRSSTIEGSRGLSPSMP